MRRAARFALALWICLGAPAAGAAAESKHIAARAERLLSAWRIREAAELLRPYEKDPKREPEIAFALGRLAYYRGDYARADSYMEQAVERAPGRPLWEAIRALVRSTRQATAGYHEVHSRDGRVIVRYEPGKDAVLVPYVLEAMEGAIREIGGDLGFTPEDPILVEIYPSADVLAKVSPLTEKDIETSGTIALCKYHRLMLTSPRALLRGYPWLDSLAHEFVHFAVTKISHNKVPIWLHEGIAKWQERRWRGPVERRLQPTAEHLLAQGLRRKRLITFEQMHPSMAKLPSQEDAGLAFAEVFVAVDFLHQRVGLRGIREVLRLMRDGKSDADAIAQVFGAPFGHFKKAWMRHMTKLRPRLHPGIVAERVHFKKKGRKKRDELKDIALEQARDLTHLGELLRRRGHLRAAVVEYQKAVKLARNRFPVIQNKLSRALLGLNRPREVVQALEPTLALYPGYATSHTHLGEAYLKLADLDRAIAAFEESNRLNPFNPRNHEALQTLYTRKGAEARANRAARNLRILRGESGDDPWTPQRTIGR